MAPQLFLASEHALAMISRDLKCARHISAINTKNEYNSL
jgi:hypothetical protein